MIKEIKNTEGLFLKYWDNMQICVMQDIQEAIASETYLFEFVGYENSKRLPALVRKAVTDTVDEEAKKTIAELKADGRIPAGFPDAMPSWDGWKKRHKKELGGRPYIHAICRNVGGQMHAYCQIMPGEMEMAVLEEAADWAEKHNEKQEKKEETND